MEAAFKKGRKAGTSRDVVSTVLGSVVLLGGHIAYDWWKTKRQAPRTAVPAPPAASAKPQPPAAE